MNADAVFEGGGVKGIAFIGALQVMEEHGYRWEKVAGTSAGSIVAALLSAGYTSHELYHIFERFNYQSLLVRRGWLRRVPLIGPAWELLTKKGLYPGQPIERFVGDLLRRKGICTFGDLPTGKLKVIVSDISDNRMLVLPDDLVDFQLNPETFPIARAVRMSSSIPYFFQPYLLRKASNAVAHYTVDGGLLSNFPVWLFDVEQPRWPTFGFRLSSPSPSDMDRAPAPENRITGLISYSKALVTTMLDAHDRLFVEKAAAVRTIFIPTKGIRGTQFALASQIREEMYRSGRKAAEQFLQTWDFNKYVAAFRQPVPPAAQNKSGC
ncbi:patatin-like phospholipase family protein [Brevibacillus humidisoli]|uniref:patatin-like phospholipase family protein n=1 Tax=Brevibacillus humidisoli TaxID=2895522 RepID=UPI001E32ADA3|nr:patatin-like phospholipase family protein [Brevibacillus humidisoli]UFJ42938.1 patatin-like phospholipase family protein [Brevibacillus humidisoli]